MVYKFIQSIRNLSAGTFLLHLYSEQSKQSDLSTQQSMSNEGLEDLGDQLNEVINQTSIKSMVSSFISLIVLCVVVIFAITYYTDQQFKLSQENYLRDNQKNIVKLNELFSKYDVLGKLKVFNSEFIPENLYEQMMHHSLKCSIPISQNKGRGIEFINGAPGTGKSFAKAFLDIVCSTTLIWLTSDKREEDFAKMIKSSYGSLAVLVKCDDALFQKLSLVDRMSGILRLSWSNSHTVKDNTVKRVSSPKTSYIEQDRFFPLIIGDDLELRSEDVTNSLENLDANVLVEQAGMKVILSSNKSLKEYCDVDGLQRRVEETTFSGNALAPNGKVIMDYIKTISPKPEPFLGLLMTTTMSAIKNIAALQGNPAANAAASAESKLTQEFFSQIGNIRIASVAPASMKKSLQSGRYGINSTPFNTLQTRFKSDFELYNKQFNVLANKQIPKVDKINIGKNGGTATKSQSILNSIMETLPADPTQQLYGNFIYGLRVLYNNMYQSITSLSEDEKKLIAEYYKDKEVKLLKDSLSFNEDGTPNTVNENHIIVKICNLLLFLIECLTGEKQLSQLEAEEKTQFNILMTLYDALPQISSANIPRFDSVYTNLNNMYQYDPIKALDTAKTDIAKIIANIIDSFYNKCTDDKQDDRFFKTLATTDTNLKYVMLQPIIVQAVLDSQELKKESEIINLTNFKQEIDTLSQKVINEMQSDNAKKHINTLLQDFSMSENSLGGLVKILYEYGDMQIESKNFVDKMAHIGKKSLLDARVEKLKKLKQKQTDQLYNKKK